MLARNIGALFAALALLLPPLVATAQSIGQGPWNGAYIGAHGGYAFNDTGNNSLVGGGVGLHLGYNLQLTRFLIGVEADYTWTNADERVTTPGAFATAETDNLWSVRARLGMSVVENFLLYGTVGYGGFDIAVRGDYPASIGRIGFKGSTNVSGIVFGGGAELLLTRSIMLRGELLTYQGEGNNNLSSEMGLARMGLSYKF